MLYRGLVPNICKGAPAVAIRSVPSATACVPWELGCSCEANSHNPSVNVALSHSCSGGCACTCSYTIYEQLKPLLGLAPKAGV